jgi:hypothetical protein
VFAPTDDAFVKAGRKLGLTGNAAAVLARLNDAILASPDTFRGVLRAHFVAGAVSASAAAALVGKDPVATLLPGFALTLARKGPSGFELRFPLANPITVNGAGERPTRRAPLQWAGSARGAGPASREGVRGAAAAPLQRTPRRRGPPARTAPHPAPPPVPAPPPPPPPPSHGRRWRRRH